MSIQAGNDPHNVEDSNVGPGFEASGGTQSSTPEASETSTTQGYATEVQPPKAEAGQQCAVIHQVVQQIQDQAAKPIAEDDLAKIHEDATTHAQTNAKGKGVDLGHDNQGVPENVQHDTVPGPDNFLRPRALPKVLTKTGTPTNLTTPAHYFKNWDDYKMMCLAGPQITLVLVAAGGIIQLTCSRKVLKDFSSTFKKLDPTFGDESIRVDHLFEGLPIKDKTATFVQLYQMIEAGGLPYRAWGVLVTFGRLIDMHVMADHLDMPLAKDWIYTFIEAQMQELTMNWAREYATACMLDQTYPPGTKHYGDGHLQQCLRRADLRPLDAQTAKLVDIHDSYMRIRYDARSRVVKPDNLARLVAVHCPRALFDQVERAGQLYQEFINAVGLFNLERHAKARAERIAAGYGSV